MKENCEDVYPGISISMKTAFPTAASLRQLSVGTTSDFELLLISQEMSDRIAAPLHQLFQECVLFEGPNRTAPFTGLCSKKAYPQRILGYIWNIMIPGVC